jgi:hypothetical protein
MYAAFIAMAAFFMIPVAAVQGLLSLNSFVGCAAAGPLRIRRGQQGLLRGGCEAACWLLRAGPAHGVVSGAALRGLQQRVAYRRR